MGIEKASTAITSPNQLGRLSAVMCAVVAVGGILAEILLAWAWLTPVYLKAFVAPHLGIGDVPVALDGGTRLAGFAVSMIPMLVLFYLLYQAFKLFASYWLGRLFTDDAPIRLRRIGASLIVLAVLRPISRTLVAVVLTVANPPGQHILAIGLTIDDYMLAALGGLLLAIGHVMVEAKRLSDDHKQIV